jgi:hypothetical protein
MASLKTAGGPMPDKKNRTPFYLIDTDADFYRPFGVRLTICVLAVSWAALEIYNRDGFWGVVSGAAAIYCIYTLFVSYNPPPKEEPATRMPDPETDEITNGPQAETKVDDLLDQLFDRNASWPELIKAIRSATSGDIFAAEKIALTHAGWRTRCNHQMNHDPKCRKQAAHHLKAHGPNSLIASVDGRYVVVEPIEAPRTSA